MKNEEKHFVPYDESVQLKNIGFNDYCLAIHRPDKRLPFVQPINITNSEIEEILSTDQRRFKPTVSEESVAAPLFQQAFEFFRKNHMLYAYVKPRENEKCNIFFYEIISKDGSLRYTHLDSDNHNYDKAQLECLRKLIEISKNA